MIAPIIAHRLCLDFINTEIREDGERVDLIPSYAALVEWAREAGALDKPEADYVRERWRDGPEAEAGLQAARSLRRQLRSLAEQLVRGNTRIPGEIVEAINQLLRSRPGYLQLEPAQNEWAARWKVPLRRADDVLWRVARSAASLLADDDLSLVKQCERASCGLFFFDNTRNHRKRWCRMDVCGAGERAAAYYRRRKSG